MNSKNYICFFVGVFGLVLTILFLSFLNKNDPQPFVVQKNLQFEQDELSLKFPCHTSKIDFFGQHKQDKIVYENFFSNPQKCYLTFLDVGAYDGKRISNTLFFEKYLGWHGICIEAVPDNFFALSLNRPGCININCAAFNESGKSVLFPALGTMSSLGKGNTTVTTCRIDEVLLKHNIKNIDFFSIDIEDSELFALQGIDFSKITIKVINLEFAKRFPQRDAAAKELLIQNGFSFFKKSGSFDEIWVNNDFI